MKTAFATLLVCFFPLALLGSDRPALVDNSSQTEIKDFLESAAGAFNSENLDAYEMCFAESRRKSMRRKVAVLFASERCSMELVEAHTVEMCKDSAEVAVRYKIGGSNCSSEVVSMVRLVRESGRWAIAAETRISGGQSEPPSGPPLGSADAGGVGWDCYSPNRNEVSGRLQHLIGDIGVRPGMGCSGGRCDVLPCQNGRCGL